MKNIRSVLRFGWPYLRRYRSRLVVGVLLGVLFGFSNASFVWATKTVIGRMDPGASHAERSATVNPAKVSEEGVKGRSTAQEPRSWLARFKENLERHTSDVLDPWLPALGQPVGWRQILGGLLFFPALVAVRGFVGYGSSYSLGWVSERVVNDLRVEVLRKLSSLSLDFFNRSTMGDLITHVNGDTASLQRCLSLGVSDLIKEPVTIFGMVVMLCLIDWQMTLGALVFFPVCVVPIIVLGKKVRRASKAGLHVNITQSSLLVEMLSGIRVVKAFGLEETQVKRFQKLSSELVHHGMKGIRAKELINPIIETVSMVGFGLLIVYIAAKGRAVAEMVAFLTGLVFFYTPVKKLAGLHVLFEQTTAGVGRLMKILSERPTVEEKAGSMRLEKFEKEIRLEGLRFSYSGQPVLHGIDLVIPRGARVGIAGESGSGKSTLVNLLFRFYDPTGGAILVDGINLRDVALGDLRGLMALVSQEIVLFDLTVAENIACGKTGATRDAIESAAKAAQAHEFIIQLPSGYETRIGERGVTLSGGQRQRLAIARAFVRDAPVLVLDEATASLDSQSEAEVQSAIDRLSENRTVITVAHRLSTLAVSDLIVVLNQGSIVEQGRFDELLKKEGWFAAMARKQGITPQTSVLF